MKKLLAITALAFGMLAFSSVGYSKDHPPKIKKEETVYKASELKSYAIVAVDLFHTDYAIIVSGSAEMPVQNVSFKKKFVSHNKKLNQYNRQCYGDDAKQLQEYNLAVQTNDPLPDAPDIKNIWQEQSSIVKDQS